VKNGGRDYTMPPLLITTNKSIFFIMNSGFLTEFLPEKTKEKGIFFELRYLLCRN
jgi:hypothetical protein